MQTNSKNYQNKWKFIESHSYSEWQQLQFNCLRSFLRLSFLAAAFTCKHRACLSYTFFATITIELIWGCFFFLSLQEFSLIEFTFRFVCHTFYCYYQLVLSLKRENISFALVWNRRMMPPLMQHNLKYDIEKWLHPEGKQINLFTQFDDKIYFCCYQWYFILMIPYMVIDLVFIDLFLCSFENSFENHECELCLP